MGLRITRITRASGFAANIGSITSIGSGSRRWAPDTESMFHKSTTMVPPPALHPRLMARRLPPPKLKASTPLMRAKSVQP